MVMERYICENVFVPLRSGPSHKTEMLSQVLFGEKYTVIDKSGNWLKIETDFDKYRGWIDMDHVQHSPDTEKSKGYVLNKTMFCHKNDNSSIVLEPGCEIYNPDFENKSFRLNGKDFRAPEDFNDNYITTSAFLSDIALRFINSPYIWGGRIPCGIDCSGFTQLVYKIYGVPLPRDSSQQAETGRIIDFIDASESGDLVFFDNERGNITHVGMILAKGLVIHASGRVRIDAIDHQGIYKPEKKGYSHKLRIIRRILPDVLY